MKIGTTDVIRLYKQEYVLSSNPSGFVTPVETDPTGKACPLNTYASWNGNYYKCVQTEVLNMNNGSVMHKRVNITFNANGGSGGSTQTRTWGVEQITEPSAPTREGYTFDGWYTAASGGTVVTFPSTTPLNNVTYYAQWTQNMTMGLRINGGALQTINLIPVTANGRQCVSIAFVDPVLVIDGVENGASTSMNIFPGNTVDIINNGAFTGLYLLDMAGNDLAGNVLANNLEFVVSSSYAYFSNMGAFLPNDVYRIIITVD